MSLVTVTASGNGKSVDQLTVKTANDAQLGNLAVVYIVASPKSASANEVFRVYALVKRFTAARRVAGSSGGRDTPPMSVTIFDRGEDRLHSVSTHVDANYKGCSFLQDADGWFESGKTSHWVGVTQVGLSSGRSTKVQPSPPEEVLDTIVATAAANQGCTFTPEGDDSGSG